MPVVKGMENRAPAYLKRMSFLHEKDCQEQYFKRKIALSNTDNYIKVSRHNNGRFYYHFNQRVLDEYINKYYSQLNEDYFYHAVGSTMQGVYLLYAGENNFVYVGSVSGTGRSFTDRWKDHRYHLTKNDHHCPKLQIAFNKTGILTPIIFYSTNASYHELSDKKILDTEQYLIKRLWQYIYNERKY